MNHWKNYQTAQSVLEKFGYTPEIVGRFSHFIGLQKQSLDSFEESITREYQTIRLQYPLKGQEPYLEKSKLRKIAKESYKSLYGIRVARDLIHQQLEAYPMQQRH